MAVQPNAGGASERACLAVGKPPEYHGEDEKWAEWEFGLRAYLSMTGISDTLNLVWAQEHAAVIALAGSITAVQESSRNLYYVLAMIVRGKAQLLIRAIEVGNGFECWRQLVKRYGKRDDVSTMGLLLRILGYSCGRSSWTGRPSLTRC